MQDAGIMGGARDGLSRIGVFAPILIVAYAIALLALRYSLSPYLEVDEAQFVGHMNLSLVYENSHPPLYNWLLRAVLEATGWNWALSTGAVKYALLGGFYLLTWDAARRLGGPRAGLLAVAGGAFLPQVVWMSVHTLAHSTMVLTGVAATAHAAVVLMRRPSRLGYVWLGVALAIGGLAKYNYFLFAGPFFFALALSPALRPIFFGRGARITACVFATLLTPVLIAAALNLTASSSRMEKLYLTDQELPWYDVPGVGMDGLVSFMASVSAWLGPLLLVWAVARWRDGRLSQREIPRPETAEARRALGLTMLISAGLFAAIVLVADMHTVHERYLTPIFAVAPLWLALSAPLGGSARAVAALAAALFLGALVGFWGMASFGTHRYGYDYDAIASEIRALDPAPAVVLSPRHDDAANVTLALGWRGRAEPGFAPLTGGAVLLWRGADAAPEDLVEEATEAGLAPASDARVFDMAFRNFSGAKKTFAFQLYAPLASSSEGAAAPTSGASPGSE